MGKKRNLNDFFESVVNSKKNTTIDDVMIGRTYKITMNNQTIIPNDIGM